MNRPFISRLSRLYSFSRFFLFFLAFLACLAFLASFAFAVSSVNVPLDSWVYDALDRLEGYGLIDSALSGTKPYSRLEVGRLVAEAIRKWEDLISRRKPSGFAENKLIPLFFERFKREFKPELIEWGAVEGTAVATYLKPVDEVIAKYVFQTHNPIMRPQGGNPPTHTIYPIYYNDGIVYQKYNNFSAELQGEARLWNHFSIYYRPIFKAFENETAYVDLEKGYFKAEAFNLELEVGRDSLWWGPGYNGALLMTNNARPFDLIKFSNPQPFLIPFLGPFKFNIFVAKLDYDQPIAHPLIHGLRLNFKPHPILELGISQIAIFDGEGRRDLSFWDYISIIYGNTNEGGKKESNKQLSIDFSLRWPNMGKILPVARSLKFYGEIGAEDTGYPPDRRAYLFGLLLNDLFLTGRMSLRLEYAITSVDGPPTAWYTHSSYPPTFHERIFGHHVGSNAQDIFVRLASYLSTKLQLGLDFDAETQGLRDAVTTQSYQWGADLDYWISSQMNIKGRYILESFRDPSSIAGGDAIHHLFSIEFRQRF
jgi:hypothetical protein